MIITQSNCTEYVGLDWEVDRIVDMGDSGGRNRRSSEGGLQRQILSLSLALVVELVVGLR